MKKPLIFLLLCCLCSVVWCASGKKMKAVLPLMKASPQIDGVISPSERAASTEVMGLLRYNSEVMTGRQGTYYFAMTEQGLYVAANTTLPPKHIPLVDRVKKRDGAVFLDDSVELDIFPPHQKFVYQLLVNPQGTTFERKYPVVYGSTTHTDHQPWNPNVQMKSRQANGAWTVEMLIPLAELDSADLVAGSVWGFLAGRNWQNPGEMTTIKQVVSTFVNPEEMAEFTYAPLLSYASFLGVGENAAKGDFKIACQITNPSSRPVEVLSRISVVSDSAPRFLDTTVTVPAKSTLPVVLKFEESNQVVRAISILLKDVAKDKELLNRQVTYDPTLKSQWNDPQQKRSAELEIGVYPYYKMIRARYGNPAEKVSGWKNAQVAIVRKDGAVVKSQVATAKEYGFETVFNFVPEPGEYLVKMELADANGKKSTKERAFVIEKYGWEHNKIGLDRIIIPPFKELSYPDARTVKATSTGYHFAGGFFDRISAAEAESILAAPITLTINGEVLKEESFKMVEKSADRTKTTGRLTWSGGAVNLAGTMDYDGFYRFTMNFAPKGTQKIDSAVLTIPLKNEYSQQIHALCNQMKYNDAKFLPAGNGVVWKSADTRKHPMLSGNFMPYVWMGTLDKGVAWMSESDRYWSLDPKKSALEVVATPKGRELRIHLVNAPTQWKESFTLEQAIQATPVKPQPDYKHRLTERSVFQNCWNLCTYAGAAMWGAWQDNVFYPRGKDYSMIQYFAKRKFEPAMDKKMIDDFVARHSTGFTAERVAFLRRHLERGIVYAKMAKYIIPYVNARFSHLDWPEYRTYRDEWWCSEYRADNADEYNNTPTKSYQDCVVYYMRELVRAGMEGIYYDNIRDWTNPNDVTGPAYRRPDGKMQPYFDLFALRELVKRTAVMLYQEKATFPDGRPILTAHMTNTNMVHVLAFASISLDLEAEFGSKDFQNRFTEGYLRTCTLGLQSGVIPEILVQISGNNREFVTRTFLSVTLAYDLHFVMSGGGPTPTWANTWRKLHQWGYGSPEVKVTPCWKPQPVSADLSQWRLTTYSKAGEMIVAVCSFGETGTGTLDVSGCKAVSAVDFESGKALEIKDGKINLEVPKHDFKLLKLTVKQ